MLKVDSDVYISDVCDGFYKSQLITNLDPTVSSCHKCFCFITFESL